MRVENLMFNPLSYGYGTKDDDPIANSVRSKNLLFSFFSLIQREAQPLQFFQSIATLYTIFQNLLLACWPHMIFIASKNEKAGFQLDAPDYEAVFANIFFLYSINGDETKMSIYSIVIIIICLFFFLASLTCIIIFSLKLVPSRPLVYLFNYYRLIINNILIFPFGFQMGRVIAKIIAIQDYDENAIDTAIQSIGTGSELKSDSIGDRTLFIVIAVFTAIFLVISIISTICFSIYDANSIYITNSSSMSFDGIYRSVLLIVPSLIALLSYLLPLFNSILRFIPIALHIVFCIGCFIWTFWLPLGHLYRNAYDCAMFVSCFVTDIICLTPIHSKWYKYVIIVCLYLILSFAFRPLLKYRVKSITKIQYQREKKQTKSSRGYNNFEDKEGTESTASSSESSNNPYHTNRSKKANVVIDPTLYDGIPTKKLIFALRIALMSNNIYSNNSQLVEAIAQNAKTNEERIHLARFICYFPEFQPILIAQLSVLKRARSLQMTDEFLLYQLRRLEMGSHRAARVDELAEIVKQSSYITIHLRALWQIFGISSSDASNPNGSKDGSSTTESSINEIKVDAQNSVDLFSYFQWLSQIVVNCQRRWDELLLIYPNNGQIADEYAKFRIECYGDFFGASEWRAIALQINDGKLFNHHPVSISLLRAYPNYAKQVLPKHNVCMSIDDIDAQTKIDYLEKMVDMPEPRLELQRAMTTSFPFSITVFLFLSIISFAFITIFWIVFVVLAFDRFSPFVQDMNVIYLTTSLIRQIPLTFIPFSFSIASLSWIDRMPTNDEIREMIGVTDRISQYMTASEIVSLTEDYKETIFNETEIGMIYLNNLHNSLLDEILKKNYMQDVLDNFFNDSIGSGFYLNNDDKIETVTAFQSALVNLIATFASMSRVKDASWFNSTDIYDACLNGLQLLDQVDTISDAFQRNEKVVFDKISKRFQVPIISVCIVHFVISVVLPWIDFFLIKSSFNKICSTLGYFPRNVALKAANPIVKPTQLPNKTIGSAAGQKAEEKENIDEAVNISKQPKVKNITLILCIFSSIMNIFMIGLLIWIYLIGDNNCSQFVSLSSLVHQASIRTCRSTEIIYALLAANLFGLVVPDVSHKYVKRLPIVINKFVATHEACRQVSLELESGLHKSFSNEINDLRNKEKCPRWENPTIHETLACLSMYSGVSAYIDIARGFVSDISNPNILHSSTFINMIHFELSHLYYDLSKIPSILIAASNEESSNYNSNLFIFAVASIIVACVTFVLDFYIYLRFKHLFNLLFAFISRILPSDIVENNELLRVFLGIRNGNKGANVSDATLIIQEYSLPILFVDRASTIEGVNHAFPLVFGYEPNFIVSQPVSTIIEDESILVFIDNLKFFGGHDSITKSVMCKKGNGHKALFNITFIPIHDTKNKKSKSDKSFRTTTNQQSSRNPNTANANSESIRKSLVNSESSAQPSSHVVEVSSHSSHHSPQNTQPNSKEDENSELAIGSENTESGNSSISNVELGENTTESTNEKPPTETNKHQFIVNQIKGVSSQSTENTNENPVANSPLVKEPENENENESSDLESIHLEEERNKEKGKEKEKDDEDDEDEYEDEAALVHHIALIFVDEQTERVLQTKYQTIKASIQKLSDSIYPPALKLCNEGRLHHCGLVLIKLENSFNADLAAQRVLLQRQHIYDEFFEMIKIYSLLTPVFAKNGIFVAVASGSNDPTELAIECLNFAFTVVDYFTNMITNLANNLTNNLSLSLQSNFIAVVETAGEIEITWTGDETKMDIIRGELLERAMRVIENSPETGNVFISKTTYDYVAQHDLAFTETKVDADIDGNKVIYNVSFNSNSTGFLSYTPSKKQHSRNNSSENIPRPTNLKPTLSVSDMPPDETMQTPSDSDSK